jgi:hypothetical protein
MPEAADQPAAREPDAKLSEARSVLFAIEFPLQ